MKLSEVTDEDRFFDVLKSGLDDPDFYIQFLKNINKNQEHHLIAQDICKQLEAFGFELFRSNISGDLKDYTYKYLKNPISVVVLPSPNFNGVRMWVDNKIAEEALFEVIFVPSTPAQIIVVGHAVASKVVRV